MSISAREFLLEAAQYAGESGASPDSDQALSYLNRARRLLWPQGDWEGTIIKGFVRLNDCRFFLAHPGEIIKQVYPGRNNLPKPVHNGDTIWSNTSSLSSCCSGNLKMPFFRSGNKAPLLAPFPTGHQLGLLAVCSDDAGKEIEFIYDDVTHGRKIEKITLLDDFKHAYQDGVMSRLVAVNKPKTIGKIRVLARKSFGGELAIHDYAPDEINPMYHEHVVTCRDKNCPIVVRVKKRFIPISDLAEQIDLNPDAVEWAMQAATAKEAKDQSAYAQAIKFARDHLQLEKEDFQNTITASRDVPMSPHMVVADETMYDL